MSVTTDRIPPARFIAAFFGTLEYVTVNGVPRLLDKPAHVAPGDHWQLTADGLWFSSSDWTPLILPPFAEAQQ